MSGYSNGIQTTHVISVTTSGTTPAGNIVGPAGLTGRIMSVTARTTTGFTIADAVLTARTKGGAGNTYGTMALPFSGSAIDDLNGNFVIDDVSDTPTHVGRIAADEIVELVSDGGHTAGAAEVTVNIEWS